MSEDTDALLDGVQQAFKEQIAFFRSKLELPTETWRDVMRHAHEKAFVVAGVTDADMLKDLREAVDAAISQGESIEQFRASFNTIVAKYGWTGWKGEDTPEGKAWRTRTIYQTNMATSYAAGRYRQLTDESFREQRPYWRYVHSGAFEPRPQHKAWGDARLTLRYDHPFWQTHYPPNGWGCGCTVYAVEAPDDGDARQPPAGWARRDRKTGAPEGIDEGWDYAPGSVDKADWRSWVQDKLISYPDAMQRALAADVGKRLDATLPIEDFVSDALNGGIGGYKFLGFVGSNIDERLQSAFAKEKAKDKRRKEKERVFSSEDVYANTRNYLSLLPADSVRHVRKEHGGDSEGQRPPEPADYALLPKLLEKGELAFSSERGDNGEYRFTAKLPHGKDTLNAIFQINKGGGKLKRTISLVTLYIHERKK